MSPRVRRAWQLSLVSTLAITLPWAGPMPQASAATGVLAIEAGAVTSLDLDVVYHYSSASGSVTYTNPNPDPVTVSGLPITQEFGRWTVLSETCTQEPVPAGGECTISLSFFASVSGWYTVDEATITVLDGSVAGASGSLTAHIAPQPSGETWSVGSWVRGSGTNPANGVARTTSTSAEHYHAVFTGDTVSGVPVGDDGPYRLVSYTRTSNDGDTWSSPVRLNPTTRHGTDPTIAAAGRTVYVAWARVNRADLDAGGPRVLFVRVNREHGRGDWEPAIRLTSTSGRVVAPRIAAAGRNVYVVYTDGDTGDVRLSISNDRGRSWATRTLGNTSRAASDRHDAGASVAADGSSVLVAWIASASGNVKVRGSLDAGTSWKATQTIGTGADPGTALSAGVHEQSGAVAWVDGGVLRSGWTKRRRLTGEAWQPGAMDIAYIPGEYLRFEAVSVALRTHTRLGMAYQLCRGSCDPTDDAYRSDVWWQGSPGWSPNLVLGETGSVLRSGRPTAVWPSSSVVVVVVTTVDPDTGRERLRFRMGIG